MPEIICNTSPVQYLYQVGLLHILPDLAEHVIIPQAVVEELAVGLAWGVQVPNLESFSWADIRVPVGAIALPLVTNLGAGETEVLMLALEMPGAVAVLDDALARRLAETLNLRLTGTLGVW